MRTLVNSAVDSFLTRRTAHVKRNTRAASASSFTAHRIHLQKVSQDISLPTILGTLEGIQALTTGQLGRPLDKRDTLPLFDNEPEIDDDSEF